MFALVSSRPSRPRLTVTVATAIAAGLITVASVPALATPQPAFRDAGRAAAAWLAGQLVDGALPGFVGADWGLTIDALLALQSTGTEPAAVAAITAAVAANGDAFTTFRTDQGDYVDGGSTAKVLVASVASGNDPRSFGGHDWRQRTLDLIHDADQGAKAGWLYDKSPTATEGENLFGQSLAVIGLARSGGVPQPVVDFLIKQQCPGGGFRLYPGAGGTACAEDPTDKQIMDVDATAVAMQALIAAAEAGATGTAEPLADATAWLLSVQADTGSFSGSAVTAYPNTNSTGLAGQALAAVGEHAAAAKAAAFVAAQQLTASNAGKAAAHVGAIAYTPDALQVAAANGIGDFELDQWRRATSQAILGLTQVPLGRIGTDDPGPAPSPTASATTTPTATPSPTVPATEPPASASPTGEPGAGTPTTPPTTTAPAVGGRLPVTGAALTWYAVSGAAMLLAGATLLLLLRRQGRRP
jgi:LPXTG-motif cell wall-anchored protein